MKPPKFHVGQAVVRLTSELNVLPGHSVPVIKEGSILHIAHVMSLESYGYEQYALLFEELGSQYGYTDDGFAPVELLPDAALAELLEESFAAPVTI